MEKTKTINTLEELVAFAIERGDSLTRYTLRGWHGNTWLDEAAGAAYNAAKTEAYGEITAATRELEGQERWRAQNEQESAWRDANPRPAERARYTYTLQPEGRHSYGSRNLSEELGNQVYAVWSKRKDQAQYSHPDTAGGLTLKGLLKRMGQNGVGEQIAAAQAAAAMRVATDQRNAARRAAHKALQTLTLAWEQLETAGGLANLEADTQMVRDIAAGLDQAISEEEVV